MKGLVLIQSLRALRDRRRRRIKQLKEAITKSLADREPTAATVWPVTVISPPPQVLNYHEVKPHIAENQPLNEPLAGVFYVV